MRLWSFYSPPPALPDNVEEPENTMKNISFIFLQISLIFGVHCTVSAQTKSPAPSPVAVARPAITGISHIGLVAQSLDADRKFYVDVLGWTTSPSLENTGGLRFSGNSKQWVDVAPAIHPTDPPMNHVALAPANAEQMRVYLKAHKVDAPDKLTIWKDGSRSFRVHDPEGHLIEFIQTPTANPQRAISKKSAHPTSISSRIIHAGFTVHSADAEDAFYRGLLGFHLYWKGGMKSGVTDWVSMQVPDGTDWMEYMLNVPVNATHAQLGGANHFSLGVVDMDHVVSQLSQRNWPNRPAIHKQMGRDGKYQLNIYDPDGTRVEFMEFQPREKPCCSPFTGIQPAP